VVVHTVFPKSQLGSPLEGPVCVCVVWLGHRHHMTTVEQEAEEEELLLERLPDAAGIDEFLAIPVLLLTFLGAFGYMLYAEGLLDPAHAKLHSPLPLVILMIAATVVLIFALLWRVADAHLEQEKDD